MKATLDRERMVGTFTQELLDDSLPASNQVEILLNDSSAPLSASEISIALTGERYFTQDVRQRPATAVPRRHRGQGPFRKSGKILPDGCRLVAQYYCELKAPSAEMLRKQLEALYGGL